MYKNRYVMQKRIGTLLMLLIFLSGCASVTVRPHGGVKDNSQADYVDSLPFYMAGLVGNHKVNVNEACEGREVTQMQTVTSLSDWLLSLMTLSIYSPRTAKVWCEEAE